MDGEVPESEGIPHFSHFNNGEVEMGTKIAVVIARRHRSNPCGHMDGLEMFTCSSDASDGQSS